MGIGAGNCVCGEGEIMEALNLMLLSFFGLIILLMAVVVVVLIILLVKMVKEI